MSSSDKLLNDAMLLLSKQPGALFVGQGVAFDGVAMYRDLEGVPVDQRLELPIFEDMQVGMCLGLSLMGYLPICQVPRIDFLLRAADALANHLDKLELMSRGQFRPKVILRTRVGSKWPLDAGPQHAQNHAKAFASMLTNVVVEEIEYPGDILPTYEAAIGRPISTLVVENIR